MNRLSGKTALITGAARGIGAAFAKAYVGEGAKVVIGDIDMARATETAGAIGPACSAVALDVTRQNSIDMAIAEVERRHGGLDILINNAAVFDMAPLAEIPRASYDRLFAINVSGTLFMMQAAAKSMIARGRKGKIINMASQAGRRGEAMVAVYCSTKACVISLTQSAGLELIKHGINVNAIAPCDFDTPMIEPYLNTDEYRTWILDALPVGRVGQPPEIVGAAVFLASQASSMVVGHTLIVDGGRTVI